MKQRLVVFILSLLGLALRAAPAVETDVCIYGGTSAGVVAAIQAARMGKSVVIVAPEKHLGGMTSGGLGYTDTGDKSVIGGIAQEFYERTAAHYRTPGAWKWQKPPEDNKPRWIFEPHVAEQVYEDFIRELKIPVHRDEWLDRAHGVKKDGPRITTITTLSGKVFRAKMFIDATYEGDLMAAAGVDYHVGREANSVYGEQWNGVQVGVLHHTHHFGGLPKISPYVVASDPKSGVLPHVSAEAPGEYGQGDKKIQAYCFRMCLTDHPDNRIPFAKPEGYDPKEYELMARIYEAGWRQTFNKFDRLQNRKTDVNNHGPMSTDNIGANYDYPEASYARRAEIIQEHVRYQQGWFYFIANDPRVPADVQEKMREWGLARDEFADNNHWPYQFYVREARRMIGHYVMTEKNLLKEKPTPDPVGMGSYTIDSHNIQRYITPDGSVQNEGDIGVSTRGPYTIAYGSLVPKRAQCENLLVPVCVSSSHVGYGSIRMEPVFMILGQSAATAAALAIDGKGPVQSVPYEQLRARLLKDGQVLARPAVVAAAREAKAPAAARDVPGLPRVLLIGDSISIGYTEPVRALLKTRANVHRIPGNGGNSANGLKNLSQWLGSEKWDVIHFNFGLHDARQGTPERPSEKPQATLEQYERNLREMVKRLKSTNAKLVWSSITPVPPGDLAPARKFEDIAAYNRVAAKVMADNGIPINDLNGFIQPDIAKYQTPHDVHFSAAGSQRLAEKVASAIQAQLPPKP